MFKYVNDISELAQDIIGKYTSDFQVAVDCTLGNGHDCDFLREKFQKVYAFDLQEAAVESYKDKNYANVTAICDSHANLSDYINEGVNAIMFNLGYLPGGDKKITTKADSSIKAIDEGLKVLMPGGIMSIAVYHGHEEGKIEKEKIMEYLKKLDNKGVGVMVHTYHNRSKFAPILIIIEKKRENVESFIN